MSSMLSMLGGRQSKSFNAEFVHVPNADYGSPTIIKLHKLKHYLKHKKDEKKEEGQRVRCGIDATRIDFVKIPPRYKTICRKKRVGTCKVVYEFGEGETRLFTYQ